MVAVFIWPVHATFLKYGLYRGNMMEFITADVSKVGGREVNQDYCGYTCDGASGIWIVADGLGGHRGGEVASEAAVKAVLSCWTSSSVLSPQYLTELTEAAQSAVLSEQAALPQLSSMRTTL